MAYGTGIRVHGIEMYLGEFYYIYQPFFFSGLMAVRSSFGHLRLESSKVLFTKEDL